MAALATRWNSFGLARAAPSPHSPIHRPRAVAPRRRQRQQHGARAQAPPSGAGAFDAPLPDDQQFLGSSLTPPEQSAAGESSSSQPGSSGKVWPAAALLAALRAYDRAVKANPVLTKWV